MIRAKLFGDNYLHQLENKKSFPTFFHFWFVIWAGQMSPGQTGPKKSKIKSYNVLAFLLHSWCSQMCLLFWSLVYAKIDVFTNPNCSIIKGLEGKDKSFRNFVCFLQSFFQKTHSLWGFSFGVRSTFPYYRIYHNTFRSPKRS